MNDAEGTQALVEAKAAPSPAQAAAGPPRLREAHLLWGLFVLALAVRLLMNTDTAAMALRAYRTPFADSCTYDSLAVNILRGRGYGMYQGDAYFMPLFFYYAAAVYWFFGHSYLALSIANGVVSSTGCLFVYLLGRDLFARRVGLIGALAAVFWVNHLRLVPQILTETPTIAAATAGTWWLWRTCRERTWWREVVLGFALGLLLLLRGQMIGYVGAAFGLAVLSAPGWRGRLRVAVLVAGTLAVTMSPWWIRNWLELRAFVPLSLQGGINLAMTNTPESKDGLFHPPGDPDPKETELLLAAQRALQGKSALEQSRHGTRKTLTFVTEHPGRWLRFAAYRVLAVFDLLPLGYFNPQVTTARVLKRCVSVGFLLLAAAGVLMLRSAMRPTLWLVALVAGFVAPMTLTMVNDSRLLFPVEPLLFLLAARAVVAIAEWLGAARWLAGVEEATPAEPLRRPVVLAALLVALLILAVGRKCWGIPGEWIHMVPDRAPRVLDLDCPDRNDLSQPPEWRTTVLLFSRLWTGPVGPPVGSHSWFLVRLSGRPVIPSELRPSTVIGDGTHPPEAARTRFELAYGRAPYWDSPLAREGPFAGSALCMSFAGVTLPPALREEDEVWIRGCVVALTSVLWVQADRVEWRR